MARPVTPDAFLVVQGLRQCLTKRDTHILDSVVIINMQIAFCPDGHVNQGMTRLLIQHVIKKANAGLVVINPGAIKVYCDCDIGFSRLACDRCCAHHCVPSVLWPL